METPKKWLDAGKKTAMRMYMDVFNPRLHHLGPTVPYSSSGLSRLKKK